MPTMEGVYLPNPFPKTPLKRGTVHPFGGCCVADDATKGGCNHKGKFKSRTKNKAPVTKWNWTTNGTCRAW